MHANDRLCFIADQTANRFRIDILRFDYDICKNRVGADGNNRARRRKKAACRNDNFIARTYSERPQSHFDGNGSVADGNGMRHSDIGRKLLFKGAILARNFRFKLISHLVSWRKYLIESTNVKILFLSISSYFSSSSSSSTTILLGV